MPTLEQLKAFVIEHYLYDEPGHETGAPWGGGKDRKLRTTIRHTAEVAKVCPYCRKEHPASFQLAEEVKPPG